MMRGYGYGYGPMMNSGTGLFLAFLFLMFGVLVVAVIVLLVVWAVRASRGQMHPVHHAQVGAGAAPTPMPGQPPAQPPGGPGHDEAIAIAKRRLASGEISKDQYDEIIKTLNS